ncbi:TIGR03087 family PEP-CTERM/XrtA system glycosyltransferase [Sphingomonas sp. JC676]|uniref:TIGR03087 family PEP-CTERM/XrtA system glycosyltransferase n=1 Tax=Sphingomonas sp. JC676 TaxID=2768065 RepID=UPI001658437F|nr:TIGR03087 family PEP-CTERM/XrtA system glycosyltransferase [Sphingomonas sp. JC676]MBC9031199.1 TIGR03087 family PEP-CTERM/XrtA system glycosyltransferase [Sphingomonas sp. JC676]
MGDILFLAHRVPYPPNRGDKIRGFHLLKYLSTKKRVHLIAFADDPADLRQKDGLKRYTGNRSIVWRSKAGVVAGLRALASRRPISVVAFDNAALRLSVENILARHAIDTIFIFSGQMAQYLPARPRQRVIMDFVDMDSAKFAAYSKTTRWPMSWVHRREANLLQQFEKHVAARADASLFVSEAEAQLFRDRTGADCVHVIENGIDTEYYDPTAEFRRIETMDPLVVFTGQMDYRPNIEAVTWFAEAIFPHIRLVHPEARFAIVGRAPSDAVKALAKLPGVTVTGPVNDVRGWLAAASVVVAPLKMARGIQNKVLEGMAMARPVVASSAAAEGLDHGGTIRVGSSVAEIADAVNDLLSRPAEAAELGAVARRQVIERYSWEARLAPLDAVLGLPLRAAKAERMARRTAA